MKGSCHKWLMQMNKKYLTMTDIFISDPNRILLSLNTVGSGAYVERVGGGACVGMDK